jgi:hypothetical protein
MQTINLLLAASCISHEGRSVVSATNLDGRETDVHGKFLAITVTTRKLQSGAHLPSAGLSEKVLNMSPMLHAKIGGNKDFDGFPGKFLGVIPK